MQGSNFRHKFVFFRGIRSNAPVMQLLRQQSTLASFQIELTISWRYSEAVTNFIVGHEEFFRTTFPPRLYQVAFIARAIAAMKFQIVKNWNQKSRDEQLPQFCKSLFDPSERLYSILILPC